MRKTIARVPGELTDRPEYRSAPEDPNTPQVQSWTAELRNGNRDHRDSVIKAHLKFARMLALTAKTSNKNDAIGVALSTLVEIVEWCCIPGNLTDDNITAVIRVSITRRLRDFVATDRTFAASLRTFKRLAEAGEINPEGHNTNPKIVGIVSLTLVAAEDYPDGDENSPSRIDEFGNRFVVPYSVPTARQEEPSTEFLDVLRLAIHNETEARIVELRAEGFSDYEIADEMDYTPQRIGQYRKAIGQRFFSMYAG